MSRETDLAWAAGIGVALMPKKKSGKNSGWPTKKV